MKTSPSLVVLMSGDGSTGKVVSGGLIPYEDAVVKARQIAKAVQTDPAFPVVEVWSGAVRRFAIAPAAKSAPEAVAEPTEEAAAKSKR